MLILKLSGITSGGITIFLTGAWNATIQVVAGSFPALCFPAGGGMDRRQFVLISLPAVASSLRRCPADRDEPWPMSPTFIVKPYSLVVCSYHCKLRIINIMLETCSSLGYE